MPGGRPRWVQGQILTGFKIKRLERSKRNRVKSRLELVCEWRGTLFTFPGPVVKDQWHLTTRAGKLARIHDDVSRKKPQCFIRLLLATIVMFFFSLSRTALIFQTLLNKESLLQVNSWAKELHKNMFHRLSDVFYVASCWWKNVE